MAYGSKMQSLHLAFLFQRNECKSCAILEFCVVVSIRTLWFFSPHIVARFMALG